MEEEEQVYCICRTSDVKRFMIGCDKCEEWYHGDCVNVTEKASKYIKRYYCKRCRTKDPKLEVVYKSKYKDDQEHIEREKRREEKKRRREERQKKEEAQAKKIKKLKIEESRHSSVERADSPKSSGSNQKSGRVLNELNRPSDEDQNFGSSHKKSRTLSDEESEDAWEPSVSKSKPSKSLKPAVSSLKRTVKNSKSSKPKSSTTKRKRGRKASGSDSDHNQMSFWDISANLKGGRQCYGHKCKKEAREGSKYCSDNCGINLASLRIMQTMPDRIREWNMTPCEAEKRNRRELESIRAKQEAVKETLEQLNRDFRNLEELIAKGKKCTVEEKRDSDDEEDDVESATVHCVTCGSDVQTRTAIRHMERCYNKVEGQTSFASRFKTQIDDERMFCDFYNSKEGTYCKRLQVLCHEHNPDEKKAPRDDEVCGYPIEKEILGKTGKDGEEFCRSSKRACQIHYSWEKLRRAELDMARVKQWMKVDELLEQERHVRNTLANRAGVLGLLLHSTFNHEIDEKMKLAQQNKIRPSVHGCK